MILNDINAHLAQGLKILQKAQSLLGEDDPVYARFETAMHSLVNSQSHIENYVKKGSVIEDRITSYNVCYTKLLRKNHQFDALIVFGKLDNIDNIF